MPAASKGTGKVGFFTENIAGALAYLTFIPAIVFLYLDPYSRNRFVRFHAAQCLLLCVAALLIAFALKLAGLLLVIIPLVGPLFMLLISALVALAAFLIWLVLLIKASRGEIFKLPVLGDYAEQQAKLHQVEAACPPKL